MSDHYSNQCKQNDLEMPSREFHFHISRVFCGRIGTLNSFCNETGGPGQSWKGEEIMNITEEDGCRTIISYLSDEEIFSLLDTVTKKQIKAKTKEGEFDGFGFCAHCYRIWTVGCSDNSYSVPRFSV